MEWWIIVVLGRGGPLIAPVLRHSITPFCVVRQFHDVVEIAFAAPNLQDVHHDFVSPGDALELLDALEFPLERTVMPKSLAINNLDGAQRSDCAPGQPTSPIAARAYRFQHFVVRHDWHTPNIRPLILDAME